MKFLLVMVICSSTYSSCMPPVEYPTIYPDSYTCLLDGYEKSGSLLITMGQQDVNRDGLYIKFDCRLIDNV